MATVFVTIKITKSFTNRGIHTTTMPPFTTETADRAMFFIEHDAELFGYAIRKVYESDLLVTFEATNMDGQPAADYELWKQEVID